MKAVLWQIASVFRYKSWIRIQDVSDTRRSLRTLYVTVQGARINSVKMNEFSMNDMPVFKIRYNRKCPKSWNATLTPNNHPLQVYTDAPRQSVLEYMAIT